MSTARLVSYYALGWQVVVLGIALKVASRMSYPAVVLAFTVLLATLDPGFSSDGLWAFVSGSGLRTA
jgi:hypothetical protein